MASEEGGVARRYEYVGPEEIARACLEMPVGESIRDVRQLEAWLRTCDELASGERGELTATFVIDERGWLRLADRHSEHVACAGGEAVCSAGEISFSRDRSSWEVVRITNQSTGYCPEPESWPAVASALEKIGIAHPPGFTMRCQFRRCTACEELALIKDGWFMCVFCDATLPREYNVQ